MIGATRRDRRPRLRASSLRSPSTTGRSLAALHPRGDGVVDSPPSPAGSRGVTALLAPVAARQPTPDRWLAVWLVEAALAAAVAGVALVAKARRTGAPLSTGPARKFFLAFAPPVAAAAFLTPALFTAGREGLLPGTWLLLYGAGVVTAGAHSVRIVPAMGLSLMGTGAVALLLPAGLHDVAMAVGFGGLLVGFGIAIARRHGG
jgi:hypothetical protein